MFLQNFYLNRSSKDITSILLYYSFQVSSSRYEIQISIEIDFFGDFSWSNQLFFSWNFKFIVTIIVEIKQTFHESFNKIEAKLRPQERIIHVWIKRYRLTIWKLLIKYLDEKKWLFLIKIDQRSQWSIIYFIFEYHQSEQFLNERFFGKFFEKKFWWLVHDFSARKTKCLQFLIEYI